MSPALLVVVILFGASILTGTILFLVFGAVKRATERNAAELAAEGIVLDSGQVPMTFTFRGFRGPMVAIGVGSRSGPGRVVLTRQRMAFVPMGQNRFGFAIVPYDLMNRFEVWVEGGKLHLHSDHPPNATGTVDMALSVADPGAWVKALVGAGARTREG